MKNIYSNIFKVNNKNLSKAIKYLKKKELVALPTETVYGLAGSAYSTKAVKKIYLLKSLMQEVIRIILPRGELLT